MSNYLFVTRGLPGAGKSTFVNDIVTRNNNINIISPDILRRAKECEDWSEKHIWDKAYELLEESIQSNKYTIFDATNTSEKYLNTYNKYCKKYNTVLVIISFASVDIETCKLRNANRKGRDFVPEEVIDRMYNKLKNALQGETKDYIINYKDFKLENYI